MRAFYFDNRYENAGRDIDSVFINISLDHNWLAVLEEDRVSAIVINVEVLVN